MELIVEAVFEFLLELILEGGVEVGTNKKYSRWIRYPLLLLAGVLYVGIVAFLVVEGFHYMEDELWRAIGMWVFALAFIILIIWSFRAEYKRYEKKKSKLK